MTEDLFNKENQAEPINDASLASSAQEAVAGQELPNEMDFDEALSELTESDWDGTNLKATQGLPKVLVLRDYCIRHKGADCSRCAIACPHDAISYTEENLPVIDFDLCTNCGICFGICDAFSSNRVTLIDLHDRVKSIALRGDTVYFTCQENIFPGLNPANNVIVLPCLACLPPEFWTLVLSENITVKISCDLSYCIDCERAGDIAESLYGHSIKMAERWTRKKVKFSETIPEKEDLLKDLTNPDGVDRRNAFTNLIGDVSDIATGKRRLRNSEVLQQFLERREKGKAIAQLKLTEVDELNDFAPLGHIKKTMMPKRQMLLRAINLDPTIASRIPVYLAEVSADDVPYIPSEKPMCPTGALSPNPVTGFVEIEDRYCIGCEICLEIYPEGTIEFTEAKADRFVEPEESESSEPINTDTKA